MGLYANYEFVKIGTTKIKLSSHLLHKLDYYYAKLHSKQLTKQRLQIGGEAPFVIEPVLAPFISKI